MALIYNATFDKSTRKLAFEDKAGNEIYSCTIPERTPAVDDINEPLTFKATQDGSTVTLTKYGSPTGSFQTSRNGGRTWTDYTIGTSITLNNGGEVSFRAKYDRTIGQRDDEYFRFNMTGKIEAWHNVRSMHRTNDFATYNTIMSAYAYYGMFRNCTSLTKAPILPDTLLNQDEYTYMFSGCTSLVKAPELRVTGLTAYCFSSMFSGCSSLKEVSCYIPPEYSEHDIFNATNGPNSDKYPWLYGVSSTGTFYTNADAHWPSSASGIPKEWNRVNAYT